MVSGRRQQDVFVHETGKFHSTVRARIGHHIVLLFDQHTSKLIGGHTGNCFSLVRDIGPVLALVANDGAVVAPWLCGITLIEECNVQLQKSSSLVQRERSSAWALPHTSPE